MADFRKIDLKAIARKAMLKYGFEPEFSPAAISAVNSLEDRLPEMAGKKVIDLRGMLWSSIDNADTEDFDQIEYCERKESGEILVRVAIADVDAFVQKGSAIDMHAHKNTTSIYTGIELYPMLPFHLSQNLTSLIAGQDRLAIVIELFVLKEGNVRSGKIYRALVKSKAKLVYEEVGAWLDGTGPMPKAISGTPGLEEQVRLQDEASQRLGDYRAGQGALDLQTIEAKAVIQNEEILDLLIVEDDRAKRIIENFMIGANGVMSKFLENARIPTIQRVVRVPKYWDEIVDVAKARNFKLPATPDAKALSEFLAREKKADPERFSDLSLTIVKLLGPGEYVMYDKSDPIGHFCLAVTSYTHATAPNRRYVDLIIQRLLKAALASSTSPYSKMEISEVSAWCTDRERASKKVERFMVKAEAAVLLAGKIGQTFDAIVTGASDKGTYARLILLPVEGRITRHEKGAKVGQKVKLRLINLEPENGFVDFEINRTK
jgi:VacB/RNase II family 3'-5' exoribonuclease